MQKVRKISTWGEGKILWDATEIPAQTPQDCMHVINVYPDVRYQRIQGFGGAFTEASAHNFYQLPGEKRRELLEAYFGGTGLGYNVGRVHMNSCDFGLGNYTYVEENDETLDTFSVERDEKEILPFIREAVRTAKENGADMEFLMSPWSPPAYMKTNNEMNHGGKLKEEYRSLWAKYFVRFIREYRARGVAIRSLTVQNEPEAVQTWDSCVYTAEEEGSFVGEFLGPELEQAGLSDVKLFIWDHNKESLVDRVSASLKNEKAAKYVQGAAVHWYTGDHFEALEITSKQYPELELIFSEGCVEYSRFADSNDVYKAEMYAHDMIGNLKSGITTYYDWNLILDEKGGPNHVGNFCAAPIMANLPEGDFDKRLTYYYIGQFSRYIKRGAVRIGSSCYTTRLETVAFLNPDGTRVVVVLNPTENEMPVTLRLCGEGVEDVLRAHSICTYLL